MKHNKKWLNRLLTVNTPTEILRKIWFLKVIPRNRVFNIDLKTGLKMVLPTNDFGLSKDLYAKKIRETKAINFYLKNLKETDRIIDCGANMGYFVIHGAKKAEFVYAVEPVETSICFAGVNCFVNNIKNFKLFNVAIGNENKISKFYTSKYFNLSSVNKRIDNNIDLDYTEIEIPMHKLDDFVEQNNITANILRMDTEGHELDIFRGATKFLKKPNACVFLEVHKIFIGAKGIIKLCDILINSGFDLAYICTDDKVDLNANFEKIGLEELKEVANKQAEVFHLFARKGML